MDTVIVRRLRAFEKTRLHRMKRQHSNAVNRLHARVILLSRGKVRNRDIAVRVGCTPQWVRSIIHRFNAGGILAILWFPCWQASCGPRRFLADIREQIAEIALSSPKSLIGLNQWSLPKLRQYIIE